MTRFLVVGALAATAAMGSAQLNWETPSDLAFRAGTVYPHDDATRAGMGSSLFGFGFEYFFDRALIDTGETSFSLDWISRGLNGDKGNMFPMMINQRFYLDDINSTPMGQRSYAYAGVGVAVMDVFTGTDTELAARVGYGRELGLHTYIEATTFWSDAGSGARATSTGVYIGYRF